MRVKIKLYKFNRYQKDIIKNMKMAPPRSLRSRANNNYSSNYCQTVEENLDSTFFSNLNVRRREERAEETQTLKTMQIISLLPEIYGNIDENFEHKFKQIKDIAKLAGWSRDQLAAITRTRLKDRAYDLNSKDKKLQEATIIEQIENLIKEHFTEKKRQ